MVTFEHSMAIVIGINNYRQGIPPLRTAVNDAGRLAELLEQDHGYAVQLFANPDLAQLQKLLNEDLPAWVAADDRLLFYFAGHGVALDGDDGPEGYLVPQDARPEDRGSFLPMADLYQALAALPCRHLLAILDCCFAGAFRWSVTRHLQPLPKVIHQERYERFILDPAWQAITSAAYDQQALDILSGEVLGERGEKEQHSPFALALFEALSGMGDVVPAGEGDGVITATELYLYLRDWVEAKTEEETGRYQTPGLWPLPQHGKGEYIFLVPGLEPDLPPAPELSFDNNPYRGLQSYDEEHSQLFFGRAELIKELADVVDKRPLTIVLGASGTGKSSLVKAGLLPHLGGSRRSKEAPQEHEDAAWCILPSMRPGAAPLSALSNLLTVFLPELGQAASLDCLTADSNALAQTISGWVGDNPNGRLMLVIDQFEELITLCLDSREREWFLTLLARAVKARPEHFRLVLTVRSDFEPQFAEGPQALFWQPARFVIPPMSQDELREVIEGPASVRVLYFEPDDLVDNLINEVIQTPGALPLLSFTLSELYVKYLQSGRDNRTLTQADYEALGGVVGALRTRAIEEYDSLDPDCQDTMRRIMLRMVAIEGGEPARRRVPREELVYTEDAENERVEVVIRRLVSARLVVEGSEADGDAYVEPAHDALVRAWDQLLVWKQEADEYLPLQRQVALAAREWHQTPEAGKRDGLLWTNNPRLPQLEDVLWPQAAPGPELQVFLRNAWRVVWPLTEPERQTTWLNRAEIRFVQASVNQRAKNLRRVVGVTLIVILALSALTLFALFQQRKAITASNQRATEVVVRTTAEAEAVEQSNQRATQVVIRTTAEANAVEQSNLLATEVEVRATAQADAEEKAALARSRELAALVELDIRNGDLVKALQRAANAYLTAQTTESKQALKLVVSQPWPETIFDNYTFSVLIANFSPNGVLALTAEERDEVATLWDTHSGDVLAKLIGHSEPLTDANFNPARNLIVTASADGTARIWDFDGQELATFQSHDGSVLTASFSPEGNLLVTTGADGTARLWDLSGQELDTFQIHNSSVSVANFSPEGDRIVIAGADGTATVWDLAGQEQTTYQVGSSSLNKALFSPDGEQILTACIDGTARLWRTSTGEVMASLVGHSQAITAAGFNPNGEHIVTASLDGSARVWDTENGQELYLLDHDTRVTAASFSPDGNRIVTSSWDGRARIWDSKDGKELAVLAGHQEKFVHWAGFSPDGKRIMTAAYGEVRVWNLGAGELHSLGHEEQIEQASFSPDGKQIITASWDGKARGWDTETGDELVVLDGEDGAVLSAHFSPDGKIAVTTHGNGTAMVWDVSSGRQLVILQGHTAPVNWASFSPDQAWIATASSDGTARVWDWQGGQDPITLLGHSDRVTSIIFSPDGKRILTASNDGSCRIWDVDTGEELVQLIGHTDWITSANFDSSGNQVVTSSYDGTVRVWDVDKGSIILTLSPHPLEIHYANFSLDGKLIVTAGSDPDLAQVWLTEGGQELARFEGHTGGILRADFSPDGQQVITASQDQTSRLWDVDTGSEVALFEGHTDIVNWAEFSPDGNWVVTASQDGNAKVWPASADIILSIVKERLAQLGSAVGFADSSSLAFVSYRNGNADIYVMDVDGSNLNQITNVPAADLHPVWSPDGTQITFCSDRNGNQDIYLVNANGTNLVRLTNDPGEDCDPTWSPDGTRIAFSSDRDGDLEIYTMDTDGEDLVQLTDDPADDFDPAWSPDGGRIAFSSDRISGDEFVIAEGDKDIYLLDADGSNIVHLTDMIGEEISPVWSSDGTQIAFNARVFSGPDYGVVVGYDIWLIRLDDSYPFPYPVTDDPADEFVTSWSTDGNLIVFHSNRDGDYEIYIFDMKDEKLIQVIDQSGDDQMAVWKP